MNAEKLVALTESLLGPSSRYPSMLAAYLKHRDWQRRVRRLERRVAKAERDLAGSDSFPAAVDRLAALTLELDAVRWEK